MSIGQEIDVQTLLGAEPTRALLDTLLTDSRLYRTTAAYKDLLDYVVRFRNFAHT